MKKTLNKTAAMLLSLLVLCTMLTFTVFANDDSGTYGCYGNEGITWKSSGSRGYGRANTDSGDYSTDKATGNMYYAIYRGTFIQSYSINGGAASGTQREDPDNRPDYKLEFTGSISSSRPSRLTLD